MRQIRDRVKGLRRVPAGELLPHPRNWRTHPSQQKQSLLGVLGEIGYADAVVARELSDGTLQLVDGHLRARTTPNATVPVLIVDLDDREAEKVLLTHDPLAAMAQSDASELAGLLSDCEFADAAVNNMLGSLAEKQGAVDLDTLLSKPEVDLPESYQVVVECQDDAQQREIYEQMRKEGYQCRVLTL